MSVFVKKPYQTLWDYLIKLDGGEDGFEETEDIPWSKSHFYKGSQKGILSPAPIYLQTGGLVEEGVVVKSPLCPDFPNLDGKRVRFTYLAADLAVKGNFPSVVGHLIVPPDEMIMVVDPDEMLGDWIMCSGIDRSKSEYGVILENYVKTSHNTAKGIHYEGDGRELDKGIICTKNSHFSVGVPALFRSPDYANKKWEHEGEARFLIKKRHILMTGPEVNSMQHLKRKIKRKIHTIR